MHMTACVTGMAYRISICTPYAATIVREGGGYATAQSITHEIGHT